jgi:ribosomal protein S18 acetylase RimI-like enzyme
MKIREVNLQDIDKVAVLISEFRVELKSFKGIKSTLDIEGAKDEFKGYMDSKFPIYAAEDEHGNLEGYIVCRVDGEVVWAESLYVSKDFRRIGIASLLYKKAEEIAENLGGSTVYNWVHPNNDKMISFLAKRGYDVLNLIEIRKKYKDEKLTTKINIDKHNYNY